MGTITYNISLNYIPKVTLDFIYTDLMYIQVCQKKYFKCMYKRFCLQIEDGK